MISPEQSGDIKKNYCGHKIELFLDNLGNQELDNLRDHKQLDINEKQYYGQKLKKNIFILYCVSLALFSMQKKTDIAIIGLTLTFIAISMIVGERLMDKK